MITIIGVRFRNVGKVYYFSPRELDICVGDHVIVETARGVEYGFVVLGPKEVDDSKVIQPLKEVIRIATPKDDAREESNRKKEKEAFEICQKKIRAHNLEMKLIDAEYTFDNNKMLFYFTCLLYTSDAADDPRRNRHLRQTALLPYVSVRVCTGFDQDGKRAEPVPEPDEDFGCLRTTDVLPEKRAGNL